MAKTMDLAVRDMLGSLQLQIAALQVQVEELTEQLADAKKASESKAPPLHEVRK
jgi:hypothetical protein